MCNYSEQLSDILNSNLSDAFYFSLGSTELLDAIYIFGISPLACVGFFFNFGSFLLLCFSKQLKNNLLYKYLIAYTFNNCGICLLLSLSVLSVSPRYYPWYLSVFSRIHKCILTKILYLTIYSVNRVLEILILLQRLANFNSFFQKFKTFNILVYSIILCTCAALNVPFLQMVKSDDQIRNDLEKFKHTFEFNVCANNQLHDTLFGIISRSISVVCQDLLSLCVEIGMTILLIVYFKRFLAIKRRLAPFVKNYVDTNALEHTISDISNHQVSFRKTTSIITHFSLSSLVLNVLNFVLMLIIIELNSHVKINLVGLCVVLTAISKPFLTIILLFKIDKKIRNSINKKLRRYGFLKLCCQRT